ncbi:MAG: sodium:calcium antiporter [Candidatus Izemoplasmataceae bacterium]
MILTFIILASIMVILSILLSNLIDALDQKSHLSSALIGGVMLAAATSLPELFTSMTAVIRLDNADMVLGNVLGSNFFNLLIMGLIILFYTRFLKKITIEKEHNRTAIYSLIIFIFVGLTVLLGIDITLFGISAFSFLILGLYAFAVKKMSVSKKDVIEDKTSFDMKPYILGFILLSGLVLITSIFLTITTDQIAAEYNIGYTVAGALFLGVITSLPELVSSFNLARLRNFNAAFGNVLGSNLFNFLILVISDMSYRKGSLYVQTYDNMILVSFGLLASLLALGMLFKPRYAKITSSILIASYVLYLVISF